MSVHRLVLGLLMSLGCAGATSTASDSAGSTLPRLSFGDEEGALNQLFGLNEADCERPAVLDATLRQYILESGTSLRVDFPAGTERPVVLASPANAYGVFLFRYGPRGWQTFLVAAGSRVQALRTAEDGKTLYVVSMWSREAPGDYRVTSVPADGAALSCATLARPDFVRSLDHGAFAALNIDARGQGNLVTRAEFEGDPRPDVEWYGYRTHDQGLSWSPPERRAPPSEPLSDLPAPHTQVIDANLLGELVRSPLVP
jgi:hypothetical protein